MRYCCGKFSGTVNTSQNGPVQSQKEKSQLFLSEPSGQVWRIIAYVVQVPTQQVQFRRLLIHSTAAPNDYSASQIYLLTYLLLRLLTRIDEFSRQKVVQMLL